MTGAATTAPRAWSRGTERGASRFKELSNWRRASSSGTVGPGRSCPATDSGTLGQVGDLCQVVGTKPPVRATFPYLAFPNGYGCLQGVDAPTRRLDRFPAVGCRDCDDNRHLADGERSDPVKQRHPTESGPARTGRLGESREPRLDLLRIGLVLEAHHAGPAVGVVTDRPTEDVEPATRRVDRPGRYVHQGKRVPTHLHPDHRRGASGHTNTVMVGSLPVRSGRGR